jgi:hypothetical protein
MAKILNPLFTVTLRGRWVSAVNPAEGLPHSDTFESSTGLEVLAIDGDQGCVDSETCLYLVRAESAEAIRKALATWRAEVLVDCADPDDHQDETACLAGCLDLPKITEAEDGDRWPEQGTVKGRELLDD